MNPCQLIPAKRTHGLQFGVFLESDNRFIKAALLNQDQGQAVPSPIHFRIDLDGASKRRLCFFGALVFFQHKSQIEPGCCIFGIGLRQLPQAKNGRACVP